MGWQCPRCEVLNLDDHHWCPTCGPTQERPRQHELMVRETGNCPVCQEAIQSDQIYELATGRHLGCSSVREVRHRSSFSRRP